jgi:alpha-N-arabinofuranosidase
VLQAMILTEKDKMILTPTYHVFKMYVPFQDATSLPLELKNVPQYTLGNASIPAVSATAARAKDGKVYIALVNANPNKAEKVEVNLAGVTVSGVSGQVLTASAMDAHNTFAAPEAIKPAAYSAKAKNGKLSLEIPAKAVVVVAVE